MTGVINAGSIRLVLSGPAVQRTFAFVLVGRLAYGLLPLCFLFTIRDATNSFAVAATASAVLAFATLAMPVQARLVDRYGQGRVLPYYATVYVVVLGATALMTQGTQPATVWVVTGLLLGLSAPALGPAMRAQWREITIEGAPRRIAYSLDSIGEESIYLFGPVTASIVLASGHPEFGLLLAAGFIVVGVTALVVSPYVPDAGLADKGNGGTVRPGNSAMNFVGVLRHRQFRHLLFGMLLVGSAGASAFIGVAALTDRLGKPAAVGYIEAAMAVGAIVGGLCWARLRRELPWKPALALLLVTSASAQVGAVVMVPSLVWVAVFMVVTGVVAAPIFVVAFTAADTLVLPNQRTEASTWVSTSLNAGNAAGTALAGFLATGSSRPFSAAACLVVAAAVAVMSTRTHSLEVAPDETGGSRQ